MYEDATRTGICCDLQWPIGGGKTYDTKRKTTYFDIFHFFLPPGNKNRAK